MRKALGLSFLLAFSAQAQQGQPNIEAGKAKVAAVCAACHGANGVSVSDTIPNLAASARATSRAQLKAFKDGIAQDPNPAVPTATMNAIAAQLSRRRHGQRRRVLRLAARRGTGREIGACCRMSPRPA